MDDKGQINDIDDKYNSILGCVVCFDCFIVAWFVFVLDRYGNARPPLR